MHVEFRKIDGLVNRILAASLFTPFRFPTESNGRFWLCTSHDTGTLPLRFSCQPAVFHVGCRSRCLVLCEGSFTACEMQ